MTARGGALVVFQQGVETPYSDYLVYLVGGEEAPPISIAGGAEATGWQAFAAYIPVGFDHILPNAPHDPIWQVSA